jgi:hypothetical protein
MASSVYGPPAIIEEQPPTGNTRQWRILDEPGGTLRAVVVGQPRSDGTLLDCWPCGYSCGHIDLVRAELEQTSA